MKLGLAYGSFITAELLSELTNTTITAFPFIFVPELFYFGIIFGTILILLSTFIPLRNLSKKIIAELIYEQEEVSLKIKKQKESKKPRSITRKLIRRNLLRNKQRLVFTLFSITFVLLAVAANQGMLDSMYNQVNTTFQPSTSTIDASNKYDLNTDFQIPVNGSESNNIMDNITALNGVKKTEAYSKGLVTAEGEKNLTILLLGFDLVNSVVHSFTWEVSAGNSKVPENNNEIAISSVHAIKLNKKLGDNLKVINSQDEEFILEIVGIHKELTMNIYSNLYTNQEVIHNSSNLFDGIYITFDGSVEKEDLIDDIYEMDNIEVIFDIEAMRDDALEFVNNYLVIIEATNLLAISACSLIILYNAIMNIYDKNYEFGILRSLGYSKKRIFRFIYLENLLQGILPVTFAVIFAYPFTNYLGSFYAEDFPFTTVLGLLTFLWITVSSFIIYTLGSKIGQRTVYSQNLYEQVQTKFVG